MGVVSDWLAKLPRPVAAALTISGFLILINLFTNPHKIWFHWPVAAIFFGVLMRTALRTPTEPTARKSAERGGSDRVFAGRRSRAVERSRRVGKGATCAVPHLSTIVADWWARFRLLLFELRLTFTLPTLRHLSRSCAAFADHSSRRHHHKAAAAPAEMAAAHCYSAAAAQPRPRGTGCAAAIWLLDWNTARHALESCGVLACRQATMRFSSGILVTAQAPDIRRAGHLLFQGAAMFLRERRALRRRAADHKRHTQRNSLCSHGPNSFSSLLDLSSINETRSGSGPTKKCEKSRREPTPPGRSS